MNLKDTLRYLLLGGIFIIIPIIPLIVTGSMFFPFITGKNFTFRIVIELMAAGWLILMLLDAQYRPRFTWILGAVSAFIASIFIADLLSANAFKSFWSNFERMDGFVTLAHLYLYFLIAVSVLKTKKLWFTFFNISFAVSGILGFMGLRELGFFTNLTGPRVDLTFGNPTYFAIYAVFHAFIGAVLLWHHKGSVYIKYLYGVIIALNSVMLMFTATRGAILGFLGGALLASILIAIFEKENKVLRKISVGVVAAVLVVMAGFFVVKDTEWAKETPVLKRFANLELNFEGNRGTVASRYMIWNMAWQGFQERPIFGWGQESFNFVFNKYYNPQMFRMEPWFDRTHNIVFDWLIAGGLVGAIAYFSIPVFIMYYLWFFRRNDHPMSVVERSLWTGLIAAYFFHNLFVFDNLTSYIMYFGVLAYLHFRLSEDREPIAKDFSINPDNVKIVIAPVIVVLVVAFIYMANIRGIRAAQSLVEALRPQEGGPTRTLALYEQALEYDFIGRQEASEQLVQMATRINRTDVQPDLKQAFIERAESAMLREIERVPNDTRTQLFMGSFLGNVGRVQDAMTYLQNAHELSPKKQVILFEIGSRQISTGQTEAALETFKTAYELAPDFDQARDLYALAAVHNNRFDIAEELLIEPYGTLAIDDDRFLRVYSDRGRHDLVIEILQKRLNDNPTNPQAYVSLAAGHLNSGNRDRAVELIQEAIQIDPSFKAQGERFIEEIQAGQTPTE